jgi:hypothetical protein
VYPVTVQIIVPYHPSPDTGYGTLVPDGSCSTTVNDFFLNFTSDFIELSFKVISLRQ